MFLISSPGGRGTHVHTHAHARTGACTLSLWSPVILNKNKKGDCAGVAGASRGNAAGLWSVSGGAGVGPRGLRVVASGFAGCLGDGTG